MKREKVIVKDERGQEQPTTKQNAQELGVRDTPGIKEQREAAEQQTESPGEPAKGE